MYFKALEAQGFKSFADKVKLEFKPGITAVVGPNGSGKSNISDALRWVMGEMSAKTLRGSKMEDVIFSGTQTRKPVGFAEVTIVMDNSDRSMPLDFEEISVTRRVYRSGESEYLINKSPCRLKDIYELFMDTGLGRDGYSNVGQGKIDEIISAKSTDRRHIFDEAAGITKYRYKKDEAVKKLGQSEDNILRVSDILAEIEGRIGPLKAQSEKAKKYLALRENQKELEVNVWLHDIDKTESSLKQVAEKIAIVEGQMQESTNKNQAAETQAEQIKQQLRELDAEMDSHRAAAYSAGNEAVRLEGEINVLRTNIENHKNTIARRSAEKSIQLERISALTQTLQERSVQLDTHTAALTEGEAQLAALEAQLAADTASLHELETQLETVRSSILEKKEQRSANLAQITGSTELSNTLKERLEELQSQKTDAENALAQGRQTLLALEEAYQKLQQEQQDAAAAYQEKEISSRQAQTAHTQLLRQRETAQTEYNTLSNKKHVLEELEKDYDGYSRSVKAVMTEYKRGSLQKRQIYGPVSSLIETDAKTTVAIETALGGAMNHIIVDSPQDAKAAIAYLKQSGKGRVTFLPVSEMKPLTLQNAGQAQSAEGYIGIAADLVKTQDRFNGIIRNLLGRTVVMDTIDHAIALAKATGHRMKIVTLQGDLLNPGGSMTGGSVNRVSGALSRSAGIKELEQSIAVLSEQLLQYDKQLPVLKSQAEAAAAAAAESQRTFFESKNRCTTGEMECTHAQQQLRQLETACQNLESEWSAIVTRTGRADQTADALAQQNDTLAAELETLEQQSAALVLKQTECTDACSKQQDAINEQKLHLNSLQHDRQLCLERKQDTEAELSSLQSGIQSGEAETAQLSAEMEKFSQTISQNEQEMQRLSENKTKTEAALEELSQKRSAIDTKLDEIDVQVREYHEEQLKLQAELLRVQGQQEKLLSTKDDILAKLWDSYELTYSTAVPLRRDVEDFSAYRKQLLDVRQQIKLLGPINVDAIEEYTQVKERYEFMSKQLEDLVEAKRSLEALIEEMTQTMTELFEEHFSKLCVTFQKTFRDLFGGGHAQLRLSDPEDVLGSGIEIDVQPPGKKLQSITLLSGGEKAFTAIALIFSILQIRPTYFCIFDEIEAALDDVNVFRFADYLKNFSKHTQFIVITHRKGTMEAADTLYGVTMQEKGVTSLLSIDISDKLAAAQ
ncbi:MAG: chromosome segregation protein SMC [Clostridia bacterium]|nr:chromosome segregation protein SMC [Clostridia bacterium]